MGFLKGHADITDNLDFVTDLMMNPVVGTIIVNLDEDRPLKGENVVTAPALLPPVEAVMAEVDGDEQGYDIIYNNYFDQSSFIKQFMMGVITYLYNGGNIVFYFQNLDTTETKTISKLLNMIWIKYGIGIGIIGKAPGKFNEAYLPLWLNNLYAAGVIGTNQFLHQYPTNTSIDESNLEQLVMDIKPYAKNYQEQVQYIYHLIDIYKKNPKVKQAICKA